ncbi:MAG: hypothetical protein FWH17_07860 [Oscillospiraceae bacterium]|nr:hypothetical protein [Oscillospiraceae bacterium]
MKHFSCNHFPIRENFPKLILLIVVIIGILSFSGCIRDDQTEYPLYAVSVNDELGCIELIYNGVVFRPYGVFVNNTFKGEQIGVREDAPQSKIYEVKGYDSDEWIVEYLEVIMGTNMILKAVGVTEIPIELEEYKEYDY